MAGVPVRVLIADDEQVGGGWNDRGTGFRGRIRAGGRGRERGAGGRACRGRACRTWRWCTRSVRGGGDDAVRAILAASPGTRVLAHSGGSDHEEVVAMLRAGAGGFVVRDARRRKLMAALRAAAAGDTIFDGTVNGAVLRELMDQVHAAEPRAARR